MVENSQAQVQGDAALSRSQHLTVALSIAIAFGFAISLGETAVAVFMKRGDFTEAVPASWFLATSGRRIVSHTLAYVLLCAVWAAGASLSIKLRTSTAVGFLLAACIILAGAFIIPEDLKLARRAGWVMPFRVLTIAGAFFAFLAAARSFRALGASRAARWSAYVTASVLVLAIGPVIAFLNSPVRNASRLLTRQVLPVSQQAGAPNVLWIVLDTARPDRMQAYDPELDTTPFLAALADRSSAFETVIGNGTWTAPSHASMFTGCSVRAHGTTYDNVWLDDRLATLAEILAEAGYDTAAFSNNPWISPRTNITQGFQRAQVVTHLRQAGRFSWEHMFETTGIVPPVPWLDSDYGAAQTNELIRQYLNESAQSDEPVFLFVNYMEAHQPYQVPPRYRRMYMTEGEVSRSYELRAKAYGPLPDVLNKRFNFDGGAFLPESDREVLRRQYDATIRYLDDRVAELVGFFEQSGRLDNTLIVITSDHGEHLGEHQLWGHDFRTYDELIRLALIVHLPGQVEGRRIRTPVQPSDLFDAVLRASGHATKVTAHDAVVDILAPGFPIDGDRPAICEYNGSWPQTRDYLRANGTAANFRLITPQIAVRDRRFKLVTAASGSVQLFDLNAPGAERIDVLAENEAVVTRLSAHLKEWQTAVPQFRPPDAEQGNELTPGDLDALRSLGYVGD